VLEKARCLGVNKVDELRLFHRPTPWGGRWLFLLDRQAVWTDVNPHALRLLAVLMKLVTHHRDDDHEQADDEVESVAATHGFLSVPAC